MSLICPEAQVLM